MKIQGLLLATAAALSTMSAANAADAIVAAEPEPMEYVRVCDAFGKGFFYIPGTETCLRVGGFVRFQVNVAPNASGTSDWDAVTRAQLIFDARSDTEMGELRSFIALQTNVDNVNSGNSTFIDEAFLTLGGFKAGYFLSYWDKGIDGETDALVSSNVRFNSIGYNYKGDDFSAGVTVDELEGIVIAGTTNQDNNLGVQGIVSASLGGVSFDLLGGYDIDREEGAIRGLMSADLGVGKLQVAAIYASGRNVYFRDSEWSVAASFGVKATDKLTITPGAQYWSDMNFVNNVDQWRVGLTAKYQITDGFFALATANYTENDLTGDVTNGFVRLQRDF